MDYERAIETLGLDEWPLLQQHLDSKDILHSEQVLAALKTYVIAFQASREARQLYEQYTFDQTSPFIDIRDHMDELNRLRLVYVDALILQKVLYRVLLNQMG